MRLRFRKGAALLLAGILSLAMICVQPAASRADETGNIGGTTAAVTSFSVSITGGNSGYIRIAGSKGTAYVADYDYYGNPQGYKAEDAYGFYKVDVTGSSYSHSCIWAPSASMSTYGIETGQSLVVTFPIKGTYKVTVTPLTQYEINGTYWAKNRFQYWMQPASWVISKAVNCQCGNASGGGGTVQPANAQVTVYCRDISGNYITTYTEQFSYSRAITPKSIDGYTPQSGSQYITYSNGTCNPATVTFYYQKKQTNAMVTVYCRDTAGNYINSYTEQIGYSRTISPKSIDGYTPQSGSQYITYNNGTCSPATVTFYYQKNQTTATVTVNCYDTSGAYIRSYTQQVTGNTTIYPQSISGYTPVSSGTSVTYSNGYCWPNVVTFQYQKYASSGYVTITCTDIAGNFIESYTETITYSRMVSPKAISGYNVASGGQYVTFSNGICTPSSITFKYQKLANPATLSVDCVDSNGNLIKSYTETLTASRTVYPQPVSGYTIVSGGQAVTYSNGTCSPAKVTFTYQKMPTPASVTVRCIDNYGKTIRSYTETVTASKTITPPSISGYTALSGGQYVTFSDGTCSPNQIDFQYQIGSSVSPGSNPRAAYPTSWDTQFKQGTSSHNPDQINIIKNISDDNPSTTFFWTWWSSECDLSVDSKYPELTAYFDNATISSIGIRNGNLANGTGSYKGYARAKRFFVKIYDAGGTMREFTMDIPDQYSTDYREFNLGATYTNVTRIEFWIAGYYNGDNSKHTIHISDIIFYQ